MQIRSATAIIPCLNEEKTAGKVIKDLRKAAKNLGIRIFVIAIDDASTDGSLSILKEEADIVIELKERKNLAHVIRAGMEESRKHKSDVVIHIDSDYQYSPRELPILLEPLQSGRADFVIGSRFMGDIESMPLYKRLGNIFFTNLVSILLLKRITDSQSGYRVMKTRIAHGIDLIADYTYTQEETIRIVRSGYRLEEVPVTFYMRRNGSSRLIRNSFRYLTNALWDILRVMASRPSRNR